MFQAAGKRFYLGFIDYYFTRYTKKTDLFQSEVSEMNETDFTGPKETTRNPPSYLRIDIKISMLGHIPSAEEQHFRAFDSCFADDQGNGFSLDTDYPFT